MNSAAPVNNIAKKLPMRMLVLISGPKMAEKASKLFQESRLPMHYQLRGAGTASSEMMDILGLGSTSKVLTASMMPKPFAHTMLQRLTTELELGKPNTGVAFTTAITGISTPAMKLIDENIRKEWQQNMENDMKQITTDSPGSLIVAIVNRGFSEDVMDAAKTAGARGGTVLNARQMGAKEALHFWGITIQEEKEMVMILATAESKREIMKAIGEKCGMHSEAHGVVISTPIDMIAGLEGSE